VEVRQVLPLSGRRPRDSVDFVVELADIYVRLSHAHEGSTSLRRQEADCRRWCTERDLEVREVFVDDGRSAFLPEVRREGFEKALAALTSAVVSTLVVWKLDRLSRRGIGQVGPLLDVLESSGSRLVFVMDHLDTAQPQTRVLVAVLSEFARNESQNTSLRIRSAREAQRLGGIWMHNRPPFGYRLAADHRLAPVEPAASLMREFFTCLIAGQSIYDVCRHFNAQGVSRVEGRPWRPNSLMRAVHHPAYSGLMAARSTFGPHHKMANYDELLHDPVTGLEVSCLTAGAEPIISRDEQLAALAQVATRARQPGGARPAGSGEVALLLRGFGRCAGCGRALHRVTSSTYYACLPRDFPGGPIVCTAPARGPIAELDRQVFIAWQQLMCHGPADFDAARQEIARRWVPQPALRARVSLDLQKQAADLRGRLAEIDSDYARGVLDHRRHDQLNRQLTSRIRALESILAKEQRPAADGEVFTEDSVARRWGQCGNEERRDLLRLTWSEVRLSGRTVAGNLHPVQLQFVPRAEPVGTPPAAPGLLRLGVLARPPARVRAKCRSSGSDPGMLRVSNRRKRRRSSRPVRNLRPRPTFRQLLPLWTKPPAEQPYPVETADIYVRLSHADANSTSLQRQEADCRRWCTENGLQVRDVYCDDGKSGYTPGVRREGYEAAVHVLASGPPSSLVVWKLDRLSRRGIGQIGPLLDVLERSGSRLVFVVDRLDSSLPQTRMLIALLSEYARAESATTSVRIRSARDAQRLAGVAMTSHPVFGYRLTGDRRLEPEQPAATTMREVFARVIAGESTPSICRDLNARAVPYLDGRSWPTTTSLGRSMGHPAYSGLATGRYWEGRRSRSYYPPILRDPDTGWEISCLTPGAVPIVSRAEQLAALEQLAARGRHKPVALVPVLQSALILGLGHCATCGRPLVRVGGVGYGCYSVEHPSDGTCPNPAYAQVIPLDRCVARAWQDLVCHDSEQADKLRHVLTRRWAPQPRGVRATRHYAQLEGLHARLADADTAHYIDADLEQRLHATITSQIIGQIGDVQAKLAKYQAPPLPATDLLDENIVKLRWDQSSHDERRQLLSLAWSQIRLTRERRGVRFHPTRLTYISTEAAAEVSGR
jgi:site-specific DNA recombinase